MRQFILLIVAVTAVFAEPPRPLFASFALSRQEQEAPYAPSGWRPSGQEFRLPEKQQVPQTYAGQSEVTEKPDVEEITTDETGVDDATENPVDTKKSENLQEEKGVYYVLHPNGFLQKVIFATSNDLEKMLYTAQLKYENVEPIRDPIYTYDPETFAFKQVQV